MRKIVNFRNPDIFKKYERQAYDGIINVTDFPPAEYKYFSELMKIYREFRFEGLAKEDSVKMKAKLLHEYQECISELGRSAEVYRKYQDGIRAAGVNLSRIEKSHNAAEIALIACEVIGIMTGDGSFVVRQKKKLQE